VWSEAEGNVRASVTGDINTVRFVKDGRISVGSRPRKQQALTSFEALPIEVDGSGCRASGGGGRAEYSKELFTSRWPKVLITDEAAANVRVRGEPKEGIGNQGSGGVDPARHDCEQDVYRIGVAHSFAPDLSRYHCRGDIFSRLVAAQGDQVEQRHP
jgi:hypothetical protein